MDARVFFHGAAGAGNVAELRRLVAEGMDVDVQDGYGATALHWAADNNKVSAIHALVKLGAFLEAKTATGATPLHLAAASGHGGAIRALVQLGANKGAKAVDGETPLHAAARNDRVGAIRVLVQLGANKGATTDLAATPLHAAAYFGHVDAIRALVQLGAQLSAQTAEGETPLQVSVRLGQHQAEQVLLGSLLRQTAVQPVAQATSSTRLAGAPTTPQQPAEFLRAAKGGDVEVLRRLVALGTDVNVRLDDGVTALHLAAGQDHVEAISALVELGADKEAKKAADGSTPLHAAAAWGHVEAIRALVQLGAQLSAQNEYGETPLQISVWFGHHQAEQVLRQLERTSRACKADREKARKERQRQRCMEAARHALDQAIHEMKDTASLDAECVRAAEEAMREASKYETRCEALAALVEVARTMLEQARAAEAVEATTGCAPQAASVEDDDAALLESLLFPQFE